MKLITASMLGASMCFSAATFGDSEISAPVVSAANVGIKTLATEYPNPNFLDPTRNSVIGQSFTVPAGTQDSVLTSISFWIYRDSSTQWAAPVLRAYVGEMSSDDANDTTINLVGSPLFASNPVTINWSNAKELVFQVNNVQLKPGKAYIAFLTGISDKDQLPDLSYVLMAGREAPTDESNVIPRGRGLTNVVGNNPTMRLKNVSELFGLTSPFWNGAANTRGGDFAFRAKFVASATAPSSPATAPASDSSVVTVAAPAAATTPAVSAQPQSSSTDNSGGGGGGGCTIGSHSRFDPMLLVLSGLALLRLVGQGRKRNI